MNTSATIQTHVNPGISLPAELLECDKLLERHNRKGFDKARIVDSGTAPDYANKYEKALQELARELARVREDERRQIAERLHDEFCQDLLVVKMRLTELSEDLAREYGDRIEDIGTIIGDLLRRTRTVMEDFYPQDFSATGFRGALRELAVEFQKKHRFVWTTKLDSVPNQLDERVQRVLFRAVRELLINAAKHARASRIKIVATRKGGSLLIRVCDNGVGFDGGTPTVSNIATGRFGLFSVRADLASLGGCLRLHSRPHKGTTAVITCPII